MNALLGYRWLSLIVGVSLLIAACTPSAEAAGPAVLKDVINTVLVQLSVTEQTAAGQEDLALPLGSTVTTGTSSLARVAFGNRALLRLTSNTSIELQQPDVDESIRLNLTQGHLLLSLFGLRTNLRTPIAHIWLDGFADVTYYTGAAADDMGDDILSLRCYAGPCDVKGANFELRLENLEVLDVSNLGGVFNRSRLTELDLQQFMADNPGSAGIIATLTAMPTNTSTSTMTPSPTATLPTNTPTNTSTVTPTSTETSTPRPTPFPTRRPPTIPPVIEVTFTPVPPTRTPIPDNGGGGGGGNNPTAIPPTTPPVITIEPTVPTNTPIPTDPPPPQDTPVPPPTSTPLP
jgi:hypothetical protein